MKKLLKSFMTLILFGSTILTIISMTSGTTTISFYDLSLPTDTVLVSNRTIGSGSKIMTDQDALVVLAPVGKKLASIALYYSNISTINSDSSRLYVKTERSWSCAPFGNAHPLQTDSLTLGLTNNIAVDTGWNTYTFDKPIDVTSDSIFIWPDLIQQVQPRIDYAFGNELSLMNVNGSLCAASGSDISPLDYRCELIFISSPPCPAHIIITDSDSSCYAGASILARTIIDAGKNISYFSKDQVVLDTTFEVIQTAQLIIDMTGCD